MDACVQALATMLGQLSPNREVLFSFQCIRASLICIPFGIAKSPNLNSLLGRLVFHILKEAKPTFVGNHDLIYCNVWPRIEEARLTMSWITRTLYSFSYMDACPPCWIMLSVADMEIPRNHVEPVTRSPVNPTVSVIYWVCQYRFMRGNLRMPIAIINPM